ncbi:hypothetical protein D3C87_2110280 [compost metagenome]
MYEARLSPVRQGSKVLELGNQRITDLLLQLKAPGLYKIKNLSPVIHDKVHFFT